MKRRVDALKPGDMVDLEGDRYADPNKFREDVQYEFAVVESVVADTATCLVVYFENFGAVGFPPAHEVELGEE